jgi:hypothetical protein
MILALKWKQGAEKLHCLFPQMGHQDPELAGQQQF